MKLCSKLASFVSRFQHRVGLSIFHASIFSVFGFAFDSSKTEKIYLNMKRENPSSGLKSLNDYHSQHEKYHFNNILPTYFSVVSQDYSTDAHKIHVIIGNSALVKCDIPSFVSDFVSVVSWVDNDNVEYFPSQQGNIFKKNFDFDFWFLVFLVHTSKTARQ